MRRRNALMSVFRSRAHVRAILCRPPESFLTTRRIIFFDATAPLYGPKIYLYSPSHG